MPVYRPTGTSSMWFHSACARKAKTQRTNATHAAETAVTYDRIMSTTPETPSRRRRIVPGGIVDLKRRLGRQGGLAGVGVGAGLAAFGALVLFATDGAFLGAIGYLIVSFGVPLLALVGVPAVTGSARWGLAIVGSAALWWTIGQLSAARVRKRVIAGWREWATEFVVYAGGVWVGVVLGLVFAARSLGAI